MAEPGETDFAANLTESGVMTFETETGLRKCIQCGDCSGICPYGYLMEYPPSRMISLLRANQFTKVANSETVWLCIACSACTAVCPSQIPVTIDLMTKTKEQILLKGSVPSELQIALENSQRYGNPMGESPRKRSDWIKTLDGQVQVFGKDTRQADVLWFVGDYPSYHSRVQASSRALVKILRILGINFAILGADENSDGDSQRLAGERGLFEMLAEKNAKAMRRYKFKQIITTDPHAYNAIKNEYPKLNITYPIQHYTEFLAERLGQLEPYLIQESKTKVTFHDPCYLGRANGIYDAPRQLLSAIPGVTLVEMSHHHKNSLCCGGGGGGMWMDGWQWEKAHTRLSEWRVREASQIGADVLAIACPYEAPRFEDAVKTLHLVESLTVKDIGELLADAIK
jgi:Fe-S oxidoreductase